jgi:hypothetical protein
MPSYRKPAAKARNEPLGFATMNQFAQNLEYISLLHLVEHDPIGHHNALEVARIVGSAVWGGATYSTSNTAFTLAGGNNPAVGTVILTNSSTTLPSSSQTLALTVQDVEGESKPCIAGYRVTSSTTVEVYLKHLTSALGAGNAWAAKDMTVAVAEFARPYVSHFLSYTPATPLTRGDYLTPENWGAVSIANRALLTTEHTAAGEHNLRQVANGWADIAFDFGGTSYAATSDSGDIASVTRLSQGIVEVGLEVASGFTTPMQVFAHVGWASSDPGAAETDMHVICFPTTQMSSTKVTAYIYKFDSVAKTWDRADADFYLSVHCAAR